MLMASRTALNNIVLIAILCAEALEPAIRLHHWLALLMTEMLFFSLQLTSKYYYCS